MIRRLHPRSRPQRTRDPEAVPAEARALGYEPRDWPVKWVFAGAPLLVLLVGIALGGVALVVSHLSPPWPRPSAAQGARDMRVPGPRLQSDPKQDRMALEDRQRSRLARAPLPLDSGIDEVVRQGWRDGGGVQ